MMGKTEHACWYARIDHKITKSELKSEDAEKYNILFLGPTGSGKSHLINHLFNKNVAKSDSTQDSVTKEIRFFEGCLNMNTIDEYNDGSIQERSVNLPVNVIDTIGFCDSVMTPRAVLEAIKGSVKVNASYIDKVIIVCSGRIEKGHLDSIKEIMKWLKLENYQDNVALVYTKCESMTQGKKSTELSSRLKKYSQHYI